MVALADLLSLRPIRPLAVLALVLAACSRSKSGVLPATQEAAAVGRFGPDPLVMRVPWRGGTVRVSAYPRLDSTVWTSAEPAPALERMLGFDSDAGTLAFVDARGIPGRIDLRMGTIRLATTPKARLSALTTADGSTIYGIGPDGVLVRFAPSGSWTFKPPRSRHARTVFPQSDGSVLLLGGRGRSSVVWRLHPPDTRILDSARVPPAGRVLGTQLGDRIYLVQDRTLVGVRTRDLRRVPPIVFDDPVVALTATPSGDRLFVGTSAAEAVYVVDRYRDRVTGSVDLPGRPEDFRMDPLGRTLLVRATGTDSAWVVDVGTQRLVGSVRTAWRPDLPAVLPDGALALAQGQDVVLVDGATLAPRARVAGGAGDFWYVFLWNGFRPRATALDLPARFRSDSIDSVRAAAARDSAALDSSRRAEGTAAPAPAAPAPAAGLARDSLRDRGYIVSFAALLNAQSAHALAAQIRVQGQSPRITTTMRDGATIYRVVLGPYLTRQAAEAVGRQSGHAYWVYPESP